MPVEPGLEVKQRLPRFLDRASRRRAARPGGFYHRQAGIDDRGLRAGRLRFECEAPIIKAGIKDAAAWSCAAGKSGTRAVDA